MGWQTIRTNEIQGEEERETTHMSKYWTVCSPSTTLPGNGSSESERLSEVSMSMGVSIIWVPLRVLVVLSKREEKQQTRRSRTSTRILVARARVRATRRTMSVPQLEGPRRPSGSLRWPLALQATSGSATSLGQKKRGQPRSPPLDQAEINRSAASKQNNPIRAPMGPK